MSTKDKILELLNEIKHTEEHELIIQFLLTDVLDWRNLNSILEEMKQEKECMIYLIKHHIDRLVNLKEKLELSKVVSKKSHAHTRKEIQKIMQEMEAQIDATNSKP